MSKSKRIAFCTDYDKSILLDNFARRSWRQVGPDDNWNFYWASTQTTRWLFSVDSGYRMNENQMINHFPTHYELTRKDMLMRNIKRYRRELDKPREADRSNPNAFNSSGQIIHLDFIPTTFILPSDFNLFVEEFRNNVDNNLWIMKPISSSQGTGIFLVDNVSTVKKWVNENASISNVNNREYYIISRYIEHPLLIAGTKFDLRLYVLVTNFQPLKAYLYREGFCRFCTDKYLCNTSRLKNAYAHLTNVSIQKNRGSYNEAHGGKFWMSNLLFYLESTLGEHGVLQVLDDIRWLVVQSLKSVATRMTVDRHCFELYGYDIIVDGDLRPWLIEVNSSPSLSATTINDRVLKHSLISDLLNIVLPPDGVPDIKWDKVPSVDVLGKFELLIDEEVVGDISKNHVCRLCSIHNQGKNKEE